MALPAINERDRRRPDWQPGAVAVLADGGEWTVPVPRMQVLPEPEAGLQPRLWLGSEPASDWFRASVEHIDATMADCDNATRCRTMFGLLLNLNYTLNADELLALTDDQADATIMIDDAVHEALALPFVAAWTVRCGCENPELN